MKLCKSLFIIAIFAAAAIAQGIQPGPGLPNQTGGGGGPVAFVGTEFTGTFADDTKPCTTSSFTPGSGSQLIVVAAVLGTNTDWSGSLTISDTQSLTWTPLTNNFLASALYGGGMGYRVWISSATAASSMTVTVSSPNDMWRTIIHVGEVTGAATTITGTVNDNTAPLSGGYTATLSAAPTADDASIFIRVGDWNNTGSYSMTGWTTIGDTTTTATTEMALFTAIRTGSTSTSVTTSSVRNYDNWGLDTVFNLQAD